MTLKKFARLTISFISAFFFIWLISQQISVEEIEHSFAGLSPAWATAALAAFFVGYMSRIERWRLMLHIGNPRLKWRNCAGPLLGSFATNNVLPFRAGDLLRAFAFNRQLGTTSGVILATLFVERLLDLLMVLVLLLIFLSVLDIDSAKFAGVGNAALGLPVLGITTLLLFPQFCATPLTKLGERVARMTPKRGHKIANEISKSLETLQYMAQGNTMIKLITWSIIAWLAEGCVFWFAALSLPAISAPIAAWLALPIGTLATLIPSTPGYVGTFDYFTVHAMSQLGNSSAAAAAFALLVHTLLWLPPTLIGGLYLLFYRLRPRDI